MNSRDSKYLDKYLADAFAYADGEWDKRYPNLPNPTLTQTFRSTEYQDMLYAQGRLSLEEVNKLRKVQGLLALKANENKVVTNAKGGKSKHNSNPAKAFDIAFFDRSKNKLDWSESLFKKFYDIVIEKYPKVFWGANFRTFRDVPHFEI
jgi:hypothetical protein